ncbi:MAG TPA: PIN domain-containing protein [Thermoanaerobaculia bacterium]
MKILVDTNVLCALFANPERLSEESRDTLNAAASAGELCVSVASLLQLREARRNDLVSAADLEKVDKWMKLHHPQILPIDMRVLASMSAAHEKESVTDRLILATARSEECRLATFRDFHDANIEFLNCVSG